MDRSSKERAWLITFLSLLRIIMKVPEINRANWVGHPTLGRQTAFSGSEAGKGPRAPCQPAAILLMPLLRGEPALPALPSTASTGFSKVIHRSFQDPRKILVSAPSDGQLLRDLFPFFLLSHQPPPFHLNKQLGPQGGLEGSSQPGGSERGDLQPPAPGASSREDGSLPGHPVRGRQVKRQTRAVP